MKKIEIHKTNFLGEEKNTNAYFNNAVYTTINCQQLRFCTVLERNLSRRGKL